MGYAVSTVPVQVEMLDQDTGLQDLWSSIHDGVFFDMEDDQLLTILHNAFHKELSYLKTAYTVRLQQRHTTLTDPPSRRIFSNDNCAAELDGESHDGLFDEVDRTLTGIFAFRWIVNGNYKAFTNNQTGHTKLSGQTFEQLHGFFRERLNGFRDSQAILVLIMMQMTNDLGKSTDLVHELSGWLPKGTTVPLNHDMVTHYALEYASELVPSFQYLQPEEQALVSRLVKLSAEFNPAQLVQGESPSAALNALLELNISHNELDLKFMELILDVSGAKGHVNHEGAMSMQQPVLASYVAAKKYSHAVIEGSSTPTGVYEALLRDRLDILAKDGFSFASMKPIQESRTVFTKARIFCMGRVADAAVARIYNDAYDGLPRKVQDRLERGLSIYSGTNLAHNAEARGRGLIDEAEVGPVLLLVQPTYMPAMLESLRGPNQKEQLYVLLTYLSDLLHLDDVSDQTMKRLVEERAIVVERDVRAVFKDMVQSEVFEHAPMQLYGQHKDFSTPVTLKRAPT